MKKFNAPEIEVVKFSVEDIITASGDEVVTTTMCGGMEELE